MANPMYGQNKADTGIDNLSSIFKVLKYTITLDDTGVAADAALVTDGIPANFVPVYCKVKNTGDVVLHSGAAVLDIETSDVLLTTSLSSLAAGDHVACMCMQAINAAPVAIGTAAKDIEVKTAALKCNTAVGTTIEVTLVGFDATSNLADES